MSKYAGLLKCTDYTVYVSPKDFLRDAVGYFQWAEDTPLQQEHVNTHKFGASAETSGDEKIEVTRFRVPKVRAFTKQGLANHLGIPVSRLDAYKERGEDWAVAVEMVEQAIYVQKFENAAAGLINSSIISKDIGLFNKQLHGNDPENPLPENNQQVVIYQLPDNGR